LKYSSTEIEEIREEFEGIRQSAAGMTAPFMRFPAMGYYGGLVSSMAPGRGGFGSALMKYPEALVKQAFYVNALTFGMGKMGTASLMRSLSTLPAQNLLRVVSTPVATGVSSSLDAGILADALSRPWLHIGPSKAATTALTSQGRIMGSPIFGSPGKLMGKIFGKTKVGKAFVSNEFLRRGGKFLFGGKISGKTLLTIGHSAAEKTAIIEHLTGKPTAEGAKLVAARAGLLGKIGTIGGALSWGLTAYTVTDMLVSAAVGAVRTGYAISETVRSETKRMIQKARTTDFSGDLSAFMTQAASTERNALLNHMWVSRTNGAMPYGNETDHVGTL